MRITGNKAIPSNKLRMRMDVGGKGNRTYRRQLCVFFWELFRSKKAAPNYDELFRNINFIIISKADRVSLKVMHLTKALGLDDYHAKFYQVYWDKLRHKLSSLILGFLNDGILFHDLNSTYSTHLKKEKTWIYKWVYTH